MAEIRITKSNKPEHKLRRFVAGTGLGLAALSGVGIAVHENAEKQVVNQSVFAMEQVKQVVQGDLQLNIDTRKWTAPDTEGTKLLTDGYSTGNYQGLDKVKQTEHYHNPALYQDPDGQWWFVVQSEGTSADSVVGNVKFINQAVLEQYDSEGNAYATFSPDASVPAELNSVSVTPGSRDATTLQEYYDTDIPVGQYYEVTN